MNALTDRELGEYITKKYIGGIAGKVNIKSKKVKALETASLNEQIDYVKTRFRPLLPDKYEFIKRDEGLPLESLSNFSEEFIRDDLFWGRAEEGVMDNFIPCSDTLIVQACSSQKPYIDNTNYVNKNLNIFEDGYADLVILSRVVVPIEYSIFYPFRGDDLTDTGKDKEGKDELCLTYEIGSLIRFIDKFNFKKIILHGPYNSIGIQTYQDLVVHYKNKGKYIYQVVDEFLNDYLVSQIGTNGKPRSQGIVGFRYSDFKEVKQKIGNLTNYDPNNPLREYSFGKSIKKKYPSDFYLMNNGVKAYDGEYSLWKE